jgi:hypothetical protein
VPAISEGMPMLLRDMDMAQLNTISALCSPTLCRSFANR